MTDTEAARPPIQSDNIGTSRPRTFETHISNRCGVSVSEITLSPPAGDRSNGGVAPPSTRHADGSSTSKYPNPAVWCRGKPRRLRRGGGHLSRTDAFRDGTIPIIATYELTTAERPHKSGAADERELLQSVFDAIDDQLWVHGREWPLEWAVEPAFTDPQLELLPLYDRNVEHTHGDGFTLRNLLFVYEEYQALDNES